MKNSFRKPTTKKIQRLFDSFDDFTFSRFERGRQNIARNTAICVELADLSKLKLAKLINTSRPTIDKILNADGDPTLSTIFLLSEAFRIHPITLMMDYEDLDLLEINPDTKAYSRFAELGIGDDNLIAAMHSKLDLADYKFARELGNILKERLNITLQKYHVQIGLCIMFGLKDGTEKSAITGFVLGKMITGYYDNLDNLDILGVVY